MLRLSGHLQERNELQERPLAVPGMHGEDKRLRGMRVRRVRGAEVRRDKQWTGFVAARTASTWNNH